jgi:hypothetical protein
VALGLNAAVFDVACDTSWQSILKWNAGVAVTTEGKRRCCIIKLV